jgi:hypothetical protein
MRLEVSESALHEIKNLYIDKIVHVEENMLANVRFYIVLHRFGSIGIVVECPRCRKLGVLRVHRRTLYGQSYYVRHNGHGCSFSQSENGWRELDMIYKLVRGEL